MLSFMLSHLHNVSTVSAYPHVLEADFTHLFGRPDMSGINQLRNNTVLQLLVIIML